MQIQFEAKTDSGKKKPRISILAPAKLNLFLEVLGKRPDGFHEIQTVMCPISLTDRVTVEVAESSDISLQLTCPPQTHSASFAAQEDPAWQIPVGPENLAVRAAQAVSRLLGVPHGCKIFLEKNIPAAAGLGGGSSDAAAVVVACLHLWHTWDRELATRVCNELGSDITFFLGSPDRFGMAFAQGRGEQCTTLSEQPELEFLVTHPPAGCSTGEIYARFERKGPVRDAQKIIAACKAGQIQKIGAELSNALQFPATSTSVWIGRQLELLQDSGNEFCLMTGSGSSCFALWNPLTADATIAAAVEDLKRRARATGIHRVYSATAWYAQSIEQQLRSARQ